jgi:hypothetical protein
MSTCYTLFHFFMKIVLIQIVVAWITRPIIIITSLPWVNKSAFCGFNPVVKTRGFQPHYLHQTYHSQRLFKKFSYTHRQSSNTLLSCQKIDYKPNILIKCPQISFPTIYPLSIRFDTTFYYLPIRTNFLGP